MVAADRVPGVVAVVPHRRVGAGRAGHRPRHVRVHRRVALARRPSASTIPARSPGANPVRQANASSGRGQPGHGGHPQPAAQLGLDLAHQHVACTRARPSRPPPDSLAVAAIRASGTTIVTNASVRTLALVRPACQVVVDRAATRRGRRARCAGHPLVPFGAVLGDGADQEAGSRRSARCGRTFEQVGQSLRRSGPRVGLSAIADPGVDDRGGHRPRPGGVVLDDRHPPPRRPRAVVRRGSGHLQDPGQVRLRPDRPPALGTPWSGTGSTRSQRPGSEAVAAISQPVAERPRIGTPPRRTPHAQQQHDRSRPAPSRLLNAHNTGRPQPTSVANCPPGQTEEQPDPVPGVIAVDRQS